VGFSWGGGGGERVVKVVEAAIVAACWERVREGAQSVFPKSCKTTDGHGVVLSILVCMATRPPRIAGDGHDGFTTGPKARQLLPAVYANMTNAYCTRYKSVVPCAHLAVDSVETPRLSLRTLQCRSTDQRRLD